MKPAPPPAPHIKCRDPAHYARAPEQMPFEVDNAHVKWDTPLDYKPPYFSAPILIPENRPGWADPELTAQNFKAFKFNALDGKIDRRSHHGPYKLLDKIFPRNPAGRTGLRGRGILGRWGPNHAADPIVTRWLRDSHGKQVLDSQTSLPILEFVSIQRKDSGEWAVPGGMVDPGEFVTATLRREFAEEALDLEGADEKTKHAIQKRIDEAFANGREVYRGYVDDPRNTDNAWMETVAFNFHDEAGDGLGCTKFKAGDDASDVRWIKLSGDLKVYASHIDFLKLAAKKHNAHW